MVIYINQHVSSSGGDGPFTADGLLIVDKPSGITSHDVVARLRRILKTRRVGHTGTLDPFATGVLVICLNRATRLVRFLSGDEKEYLATIRLGYETESGDLTGAALAAPIQASHIGVGSMKEVLAYFRGTITQVPPMYSAKKVGGVRLYEMARRGKQIIRQPVEVEIKELELATLADTEANFFRDQEDGTRDFAFRVVCSAGTYIRTLAEDIGRRLGIGAHLVALRRTRVGSCDLSRAVTLQRLAKLAEAGTVSQVLISMNEALELPELRVGEEERKRSIHGSPLRHQGNWKEAERIKLCDQAGELVAIAEYDARAKILRPRVVLAEL
jgi:tRNA pseudouridine55 synthase